MERVLELLRTAEQALKDARDGLHHATDVMPADLSSVIAEIRALGWRLDTIIGLTSEAYTKQTGLGHDDGLDPATTVELIQARLADAQAHLRAFHRSFYETHQATAKLFAER